MKILVSKFRTKSNSNNSWGFDKYMTIDIDENRVIEPKYFTVVDLAENFTNEDLVGYFLVEEPI